MVAAPANQLQRGDIRWRRNGRSARSSSLVNSTLELQGPNGNLLNEGLMTLQNSQLDLINDSLAGRGMILATGGSTITVSYSTPIKDAYGQPLTRQKTSDLASAQPQLISLKSSTLNITGQRSQQITRDRSSWTPNRPST